MFRERRRSSREIREEAQSLAQRLSFIPTGEAQQLFTAFYCAYDEFRRAKGTAAVAGIKSRVKEEIQEIQRRLLKRFPDEEPMTCLLIGDTRLLAQELYPLRQIQEPNIATINRWQAVFERYQVFSTESSGLQ